MSVPSTRVLRSVLEIDCPVTWDNGEPVIYFLRYWTGADDQSLALDGWRLSMEPILVSVTDAVLVLSMSRSRANELAGSGELLTVLLGAPCAVCSCGARCAGWRAGDGGCGAGAINRSHSVGHARVQAAIPRQDMACFETMNPVPLLRADNKPANSYTERT